MDLFDEPNSSFKPASLDSVKDLEHGDVREVDPEEQCNICMDFYGTYESVRTSPFATIMKMPCKHVFHARCLQSWLKKANTCPSCRHELPVAERVPVREVDVRNIFGPIPPMDLTTFVESTSTMRWPETFQRIPFGDSPSESSASRIQEMTEGAAGMYI